MHKSDLYTPVVSSLLCSLNDIVTNGLKLHINDVKTASAIMSYFHQSYLWPYNYLQSKLRVYAPVYDREYLSAFDYEKSPRLLFYGS